MQVCTVTSEIELRAKGLADGEELWSHPRKRHQITTTCCGYHPNDSNASQRSPRKNIDNEIVVKPLCSTIWARFQC